MNERAFIQSTIIDNFFWLPDKQNLTTKLCSKAPLTLIPDVEVIYFCEYVEYNCRLENITLEYGKGECWREIKAIVVSL